MTSYQVVIDLIAVATTSTGLKVYARLHTSTYQTKLKAPDAEINAVNLTGDEFHPEWNYTIHPKIPSVITECALRYAKRRADYSLNLAEKIAYPLGREGSVSGLTASAA